MIFILIKVYYYIVDFLSTIQQDLNVLPYTYGVMDMYEFVTYSIQSVINNYQKCGLRDLMIVLATSLPKEKIQYHIEFESEPAFPADSRYNMYVEVYSDVPDLYPTIRMADFDVMEDNLVDMFKRMGATVYMFDENGPRRL